MQFATALPSKSLTVASWRIGVGELPEHDRVIGTVVRVRNPANLNLGDKTMSLHGIRQLVLLFIIQRNR